MVPLADERTGDDAGFRAYRIALIQASNETSFAFVALLVVAFGAWDFFVDPVHARVALWVRVAGGGLIRVEAGAVSAAARAVAA